MTSRRVAVGRVPHFCLKCDVLPKKLPHKILRPGGMSQTPQGNKNPKNAGKGGGKGENLKSWCVAHLSPAGCKHSQDECPFPHLAQEAMALMIAKFAQQNK
jgi:hypothetical protein